MKNVLAHVSRAGVCPRERPPQVAEVRYEIFCFRGIESMHRVVSHSSRVYTQKMFLSKRRDHIMGQHVSPPRGGSFRNPCFATEYNHQGVDVLCSDKASEHQLPNMEK